LVVEANSRQFETATPAVNDTTLPLSGLSPVSGKNVVAGFDGGRLSSDGGVLLLREIERRLRVADRLAGCVRDRPRTTSNRGRSIFAPTKPHA
jgi:hypothetical protein